MLWMGKLRHRKMMQVSFQSLSYWEVAFMSSPSPEPQGNGWVWGEC